MALVVERLERKFTFEDEEGEEINLPDPNPDMAAEEVAKFYAGQFPSITTAYTKGPEVKNDKAHYTFTSKADKLG